MRAFFLVLAAVLIPVPAFSTCGHLVRDVGLHRQWIQVRDAVHPERPARLLEIPWTPAGADPRCRFPAGGDPARRGVAVRAGAQVVLWQHEGDSEIHLLGVAVEMGRIGELIRVRAGLHGTTLQGIVRAPGWVEIAPRKGK